MNTASGTDRSNGPDSEAGQTRAGTEGCVHTASRLLEGLQWLSLVTRIADPFH